MTTTPAIGFDPEADDSLPDESWRGVASEDTADISTDVGIKLQARSRRLLASLLRPHRAMVLLTTVVVVISELAFLVGPLIVAYGIDTAVPALANGDGGPLTFTAVAYLGAGMLNAVTKAIFIRLSARIAQSLMLDLRGRVVQSLAGAEPLVPREVHVRPGHLPDDERPRYPVRPVRTGPGRAHLRAAVGFRHQCGAAVPGPPAGTDCAAGLRPDPGAHPVVPEHLPGDLPPNQDGHCVVDRPVHRDDERIACRTDLPPGGTQRGDLRQVQRRECPGERRWADRVGQVHAGGAAGRAT